MEEVTAMQSPSAIGESPLMDQSLEESTAPVYHQQKQQAGQRQASFLDDIASAANARSEQSEEGKLLDDYHHQQQQQQYLPPAQNPIQEPAPERPPNPLMGGGSGGGGRSFLDDIAGAANARSERLEDENGELRMKEVEPEIEAPSRPLDAFDLTAMVSQKARERESRLQAGGEKKMTAIKSKIEYKNDFKSICVEAAKLGRLTRLNEHVVEAVAMEKTEIEEWRSKGLLAIQWRSQHMSVIHEAARAGEASKLPEKIVSNMPDEEQDPEYDENNATQKRISVRMKQLLQLSAEAGTGQRKVDNLIQGRKEEKAMDGQCKVVRDMRFYQDVKDVKLPRRKTPKLDPAKEFEKIKAKFQGTYRSEMPLSNISSEVAERAWARRARLDRPGAMPNVTEICNCPYCLDPSPFQTHAYKLKDDERRKEGYESPDSEEERQKAREQRRMERRKNRPQRSRAGRDTNRRTVEKERGTRGDPNRAVIENERVAPVGQLAQAFNGESRPVPANRGPNRAVQPKRPTAQNMASFQSTDSASTTADGASASSIDLVSNQSTAGSISYPSATATRPITTGNAPTPMVRRRARPNSFSGTAPSTPPPTAAANVTRRKRMPSPSARMPRSESDRTGGDPPSSQHPPMQRRAPAISNRNEQNFGGSAAPAASPNSERHGTGMIGATAKTLDTGSTTPPGNGNIDNKCASPRTTRRVVRRRRRVGAEQQQQPSSNQLSKGPATVAATTSGASSATVTTPTVAGAPTKKVAMRRAVRPPCSVAAGDKRTTSAAPRSAPVTGTPPQTTSTTAAAGNPEASEVVQPNAISEQIITRPDGTRVIRKIVKPAVTTKAVTRRVIVRSANGKTKVQTISNTIVNDPVNPGTAQGAPKPVATTTKTTVTNPGRRRRVAKSVSTTSSGESTAGSTVSSVASGGITATSSKMGSPTVTVTKDGNGARTITTTTTLSRKTPCAAPTPTKRGLFGRRKQLAEL